MNGCIDEHMDGFMDKMKCRWTSVHQKDEQMYEQTEAYIDGEIGEQIDT